MLSVNMLKLIKTILIGIIKFYRYAISGLLGRSCKFTPSCSAYAIDAITKLPLHKAIFYSVYRILRCNPFNSGGYDPIPCSKHSH